METLQTTNPATPETVWAVLQESSKEFSARMDRFSASMDKLKERQEETTRQIEETSRQIDRQIEETSRQIEETSRQMKKSDEKMDKYSKKVKELSSSFGRAIEYMVAPNLRDKFRELGLIFPSVNLDTEVADYENNIHLEIDAKLENGDKAMLVEVKTKLTTEDVKEHIKRLEEMRKYADLHGDKRKFMGAVAGVVITSYAKNFALKQGLYVIEPSGETFNIIPPNNKPKEW